MKPFEEFCRQYGYDEKDMESKIAFEAYSKKIGELKDMELIPCAE